MLHQQYSSEKSEMARFRFMSKSERNRLFDLKGEQVALVCPKLAMEIGFNESLLLLQLDYLIAISNHEKEGQRWTYQSVTDIGKMFPFWSRAKINRVIKSLENRRLITVGNFNRKKYDKTRWFAINIGEAEKLKSIKVVKREQGSFQNELGLVQIETDSDRNETTIPNMTTDITPEKELIW
jgi:hypothetical protein